LSSNHLHQASLESSFARLRLQRKTTTTHRLHRHMQTTPDPLDAIYVPRGVVQSRITFCCGNAFNEEGCHCHLAFHVSQVSDPVLAMFARELGTGPPTVLLFGESFLNSSFNDRVLSLFRGGPGLSLISLSLKTGDSFSGHPPGFGTFSAV
jgi:hypothetical protein